MPPPNKVQEQCPNWQTSVLHLQFIFSVIISHTRKKPPIAAFAFITSFTLKVVLGAVDWWEERERKAIFRVPNSSMISQYEIRTGHVTDCCNAGYSRAGARAGVGGVDRCRLLTLGEGQSPREESGAEASIGLN